METIYANWINGLPKDDQKTAAKSLIRLGLFPRMPLRWQPPVMSIQHPSPQSWVRSKLVRR
jgi:hypothetical protein